MRNQRCWIGSLVALSLAFLLTGCGNPAAVATSNDLKEIGLMYHNYLNDNGGKPPKSADDFKPYEAMYAKGQQGLKAGKYVMIWNAKLPGKPEEVVVAYEKQAPENGGYVMLADASVVKMSASEFKAAKKAQPESTTTEPQK